MSTMKASASPAAPTPRRSKREAADASASPSCGEASRKPNANGGGEEERSADARSRRPRGNKKTQKQSNAESSARKEKSAASSSARIDNVLDDLGNVLIGSAVSGRKLKRIQGSIKTLRNVARELRSYKHDDDSDDENCSPNRSRSTPESSRAGKTSNFKLSPSDESSVCCSLFKSSSDDDSECSEDESDSDESNGLSNGRSKARKERANTSYSYSFGTTPPRVDLAADRRHRQDSADAAKKRREEEEESARAAVAEDKRREEEARVRMEEDAADERRRRAKEAAQMAQEQRRMAQADAIEEVRRAHVSDWYSHYEVLGVFVGASAEAIKRAYKNLARKLHPDKSTLPGAEDAFKVINVAYEVLNDPNSRAEYDRSCQAQLPTWMPTQPDFTPGSSALTIIPNGTRVTFCNLNLESQHLQGERGTVEGFSDATRQYLVRLDNQLYPGGSTFNADPVILFQNVTVKLRWRSLLKRFGSPFCPNAATVHSYSEESDTYEVSYCIDGRRKVDRLESIRIVLPKGTVVRLKGPLLEAEYSGKYGQIVGWEKGLSDVSHGPSGDPSYYTVQMSAENFLQVKMANVRL